VPMIASVISWMVIIRLQGRLHRRDAETQSISTFWVRVNYAAGCRRLPARSLYPRLCPQRGVGILIRMRLFPATLRFSCA